jgi:NADH-quinone oxidoreductase subunit J
MELTSLVFYLFALITLLSGAIVVFSRNIVRAAFALLFTFFGVAGLYVLLYADFMAVTQVLIYIGGILVLLLFGVMLTNRSFDVDIKESALQVLPATLLAGAIGGMLLYSVWNTLWRIAPIGAQPTYTGRSIGELMLTTYVLPFEVASVLLLAALIGAAMMARREKTE